jgi:hypothetical protein
VGDQLFQCDQVTGIVLDLVGRRGQEAQVFFAWLLAGFFGGFDGWQQRRLGAGIIAAQARRLFQASGFLSGSA